MSRVLECLARMAGQCAWCRTAFVPQTKVIIAGGRFSSWSPQVEAIRGHIVQVRTPRLTHFVAAVVPMSGTPAHAAGYDVLFVLCSPDCRRSLEGALHDEVMQLTLEGASVVDAGAINWP
ncbi:MAG: hypothetical protein ACRD26_11630 [Vicinamibacterales bacterium]